VLFKEALNTKNIIWNAEASYINNGRRVTGIKYGLTLSPNRNLDITRPTIINSNSTFHRTAIQNLPRQ